MTITALKSIAGTISGAGSLCLGNTKTLTLTGNAGKVQWQSSTDNTNFSNISGATSATYDVLSGLTITTYYRRITVATLNSIACQSIPTNVLTVTVQSVPTAGSIATSQTICYNGDPAAFTSVAGTGIATSTITYIWQSSTDNTNFSTIASANENIAKYTLEAGSSNKNVDVRIKELELNIENIQPQIDGLREEKFV